MRVLKKNKKYAQYVPRKILLGTSAIFVLLFYDVIRKVMRGVLWRDIRIMFPDFYEQFSFSNSRLLVLVRHFLIYLVIVLIVYAILYYILIKWLETRTPEELMRLPWKTSVTPYEEALPTVDGMRNLQQDYNKLSSYMAHEQKNILAVLRGKIQLKGDDELLEEVDRVVVAIDDILTLSASETMIENQSVDMSLLCADVVDEYIKIYPNIIFEFDESQNYVVRGKELWLQRAISNLVENAIKYGEEGTIIISLSVQKGSVILTVEDEGKGLKVSDQTQIFELYYRTEGLKKDGYGIGLGLVKHVCSLCRGVFWVEKTEKGGARFYIVLPEEQTGSVKSL